VNFAVVQMQVLLHTLQYTAQFLNLCGNVAAVLVAELCNVSQLLRIC
jgi:hypothetical protein